MSGGLFGLLDDVAALAKLAAASLDDVGAAAGRASVKAAGVVVDDTAVTPQYVADFSADRELPVIKKIAVGSLRNKLLMILPIIMVLSQFLPWLLTPLLMIGGAYLGYEGAEKLWEKIAHREGHETPVAGEGGVEEDALVKGAIRTDFILSAEIMVIALSEVAGEPFISRLLILLVVALAITALVYGAVALIVKMDDVGLHLAENRTSRPAKAVGRGLVLGMPVLLTVLSVVGVAAMIWVGGHILLVGADDLGWHAPYSWVHHAEEAATGATGALGGLVGWLVNTAGSALVGLLVGALLVLVMHLAPKRSAAAH